jgi:hypothetical protein
VPSDGKPLPGFEQALASYQSRKASGDFVLASATPAKRSGGLFAALFGGGADEEEDTGEIAVAAVQPKKAPTKAIPAEAPVQKSLPGIQIVAPENAQRAEIPQMAEEAPDQQAPRDHHRGLAGAQRSTARCSPAAAGRGWHGDRRERAVRCCFGTAGRR